MITPIDTKPDALKGALEAMKRHEADIIEFLAIEARLRRVKYLALRKEGFDSAEALAMVAGPLFPPSS